MVLGLVFGTAVILPFYLYRKKHGKTEEVPPTEEDGEKTG